VTGYWIERTESRVSFAAFIVCLLILSLSTPAGHASAVSHDSHGDTPDELATLPQVAAATATAEPAATKTAALSTAQVVDVKQYRLTIRTIITNRDSKPTSSIFLRIPILAESASSYQVISREELSPSPLRIETDERGNRQAIYEFDQLEVGESVVVEEQYWLKYGGYKLSSSNSSSVEAAPNLSVFLRSEPKIEADDPAIRKKAAELTGHVEGRMKKAQAIFDFVVGHVKYRSESPHRNKGAKAALTYGEGVCEERASLFVALARAAGIPARVVNGFSRDDKRGNRLIPGTTGKLNLAGMRHQWAEFYTPEKGWIPVEPTFSSPPGGRYYRFGHMPTANHIIQNYRDESITGWYTGGTISIGKDKYLSTK
jgi:transglutaminase-like putative cysteine protease